jgi:hypothetical protein
MSDGSLTASSGGQNPFVSTYETREIVFAQGIEAHDSDSSNRKNDTAFKYLSSKLGSEFKQSGSIAEYKSDKQLVQFKIRIVQNKNDYLQALETEGLHVIYMGHSRLGRGSCFDTYDGKANKQGKQWEQGTSNANGLYRLAYSFVPVPFEDINTHKYPFSPVSMESGEPPNERQHPYSRHPRARKQLIKIKLPEPLQEYVESDYKSPSNTYLGLTIRGEKHLLLHAGWKGTQSKPYDLGTTNLKCRVYCHFGCSSRLHFWEIVRKEQYKGWKRPTPPTDKFAYFTTAPSYSDVTYFWLEYILKYPQKNNFEPWWNSLEWAKKKANNRLRIEGMKCQIY